jgi:hypothetical protein
MRHMLWMCGGMMIIALVVVAIAGSGAFVLAPLGCVLMMAAMVFMMVRH